MTPEQATQAWIATMGSAAVARSNAYFEGGYLLQVASWALNLAICVLLVRLKILPRVRDGLEKGVRIRFFVTLLVVAAFLALSSLLSFPLDAYAGFVREHQFGLSTQTFPAWFSEYLTAFALNLGIGALFLTGLLAIVRRAPKTWWIWGAGATGAVMALAVAVAPVFIAPLFNTYTPMAEGPLKRDILAMAEANGIPADNVYVFDVSRQSNRVTANVSGLFGTTRISISDTLIKRASPEAVRAVVAHEVGHYVLHHVNSILIMMMTLIAIAFGLIGMLVRRLIGQGRWGVRDQADAAGLPVFFAVASTVFFLATPITNSITRFHESQADIFGMNAGRAPDGFAQAALLLSEYRKMEPGPLERTAFYDHPSGYDRILMAMRWKKYEMEAGRLPVSPLGPPPGYKPDFVVLRPEATR